MGMAVGMAIIRQSFIEVITDSIGITPRQSIMPLKFGYMVNIEMLGTGYLVLLVFDEIFLRVMSEEFLCEDNPSQSDLIDMAKELGNLTVGHAKVLAQEHKRESFKISTPNFLGVGELENHNHGLHFRLKDGHCSLFIRKVRN